MLTSDYFGRPESAPIRIVKEAEQHFKPLPTGYGYPSKFNYYLPIEFLLNIDSDKINDLPGLDTAMENFEKLLQS